MLKHLHYSFNKHDNLYLIANMLSFILAGLLYRDIIYLVDSHGKIIYPGLLPRNFRYLNPIQETQLCYGWHSSIFLAFICLAIHFPVSSHP